jgi:hypothetical protein
MPIIIYKEIVNNQADEIKDFHLIKNLAFANYQGLFLCPEILVLAMVLLFSFIASLG